MDRQNSFSFLLRSNSLESGVPYSPFAKLEAASQSPYLGVFEFDAALHQFQAASNVLQNVMQHSTPSAFPSADDGVVPSDAPSCAAPVPVPVPAPAAPLTFSPWPAPEGGIGLPFAAGSGSGSTPIDPSGGVVVLGLDPHESASDFLRDARRAAMSIQHERLALRQSGQIAEPTAATHNATTSAAPLVPQQHPHPQASSASQSLFGAAAAVAATMLPPPRQSSASAGTHVSQLDAPYAERAAPGPARPRRQAARQAVRAFQAMAASSSSGSVASESDFEDDAHDSGLEPASDRLTASPAAAAGGRPVRRRVRRTTGSSSRASSPIAFTTIRAHGGDRHKLRNTSNNKSLLDAVWTDHELTMSTREFNKHIKDSGYSPEQIQDLRRARRRMKNRAYAKRSRNKKQRRNNSAGDDYPESAADPDDYYSVAGSPMAHAAELSRQRQHNDELRAITDSLVDFCHHYGLDPTFA